MVGGPASTLEPLIARPTPIDPRIRARRNAVRRVEGRRRLQRLVDVGLVVLVAAAFVAALWTPLLDVDEIRVEGAAHTGVQAVREQAGVAIGDRLVTVDLRAVGAQVGALPWVDEVVLHRGVDGVISIAVTERIAVAAVRTGLEVLLVDRDGRVLGPAAGAQEVGPIVELTGVGVVPAVGSFLGREQAEALAVAAELRVSVPGAVASLAAQGLTAQLVGGGQVRFGDGSQREAKVRSLRTVLDQVELRCLGTLDLRLPGSPVLTREERCS